MSESVNRLMSDQFFSDVVLVVEDKKLYSHKALLILHSPVFQRMFTAPVGHKELKELSGKTHSAVVKLLEQIYPGNAIDLIKVAAWHINDLDLCASERTIDRVRDFAYKDENIQELLKIAHEFKVQQVFHNCTQYISKRLDSKITPLTTDHILFHLSIVEPYEALQSVRDLLVELASRIATSQLRQNKYYNSIPATATRDILQQRIERFEKDPDVAQCLKKKNLQ